MCEDPGEWDIDTDRHVFVRLVGAEHVAHDRNDCGINPNCDNGPFCHKDRTHAIALPDGECSVQSDGLIL